MAMQAPARKGGTMLTAEEVAAVSGGRTTQEPAPGLASDELAAFTDYPRNPAGPVTTESPEPKFNRK
jgi:hypothetical protein